MIRKARFAHSWYAGVPEQLEADVDSHMTVAEHPEKVMACIGPHAGMMYSGSVAGALYGEVRVPRVAIVVAVNHRGAGAPAAIVSSGTWETPLGPVPVHRELACAVTQHVPFLEEDPRAHAQEHSLELHLPFLKTRNRDLQIVPLCLQQLSLETCLAIGNGLARAMKQSGEDALLVASTDMSHFEPQEAAERKDRLAIECILALDAQGLYNTVQKNRISMCGVVPTTAVLSACVKLGAHESRLVKYATSGDTSGDYGSVVGYAGIWVR